MEYFGHIKRDNTLMKSILDEKIEGQREKDRQRNKWENNIKLSTNSSQLECTSRVSYCVGDPRQPVLVVEMAPY